MDKPKYFFSVSSRTNPRNKLDEAIQERVNDIDCTLFQDLDSFTQNLVDVVRFENENHKRTKPICIQLWYKGDDNMPIKDDEVCITWARENQRLMSATISKVRIEL